MQDTNIASAHAAPGTGGIIISVLHGADALAQAEAAWLALEHAGGCPSPFQSWRWVQGWRQHFRAAEPLILLAEFSGDGKADGTPLALLPLQREKVAGLSCLTWLTARGLQYGGMLLHPALSEPERKNVLDAVWTVLLQERVDFIDLPLLPEDDVLTTLLNEECVRGPENAAFHIDFSQYEDWRAFELALKPSARRARKKRLNKLKRTGELTFTVHPAGPDLAPVLKQALQWKRGWLDAQGLHGALPYQPAFEQLLQALFATPDKHDAWRVAVLALDGNPIAIDAGKVCGKRFHAWFAAYDADFSEHSPGKIALWLMMQWCMENGIRAYDMLANPAPYKEEWANGRRPLVHFMKPLTTAGRAYVAWMRHGEPMARQMYHALPPGLKAMVRKPLMYLRGGK